MTDSPDTAGALPALLPPEGTFYRLTILPIEEEELDRLHAAILQWKALTHQQFTEFQQRVDAQRNPVWDQYGYEPVEDEAVMLLETERAMWATLGVSIASVAENFVIRVYNDRSVPHRTKQHETSFHVASTRLNWILGSDICTLQGYAENQQTRMLGNCFKHTEGRTNKRYVDKFGGDTDLVIAYEREDWPRLI